jgi:hypothetical protein
LSGATAAIARKIASRCGIASHLLSPENFVNALNSPFASSNCPPSLPRLPLGKRGRLLGDFACRLASAIVYFTR